MRVGCLVGVGLGLVTFGCDDGSPAAPPKALASAVMGHPCALPAQSGLATPVVLLTDGAPIGPDDGPATFTLNRAEAEPTTVSGGAEAFRTARGWAPAEGQRLAVILVDQSGSLIGEDRATGTLDRADATDAEGHRLAVIDQWLRVIDADTFVSLVPFRGDLVLIAEAYSTPQRNFDALRAALDHLGASEGGATPLTDALDQTFRQILQSAGNHDLAPTVVVFTDGTEDADPSAADQAVVSRLYAAAQVPIVIVHWGLPADSPPDAALLALACDTGGAYYGFATAREMADHGPVIAAALSAHLRGTWWPQFEVARPPSSDAEPLVLGLTVQHREHHLRVDGLPAARTLWWLAP